MELTLCTQGILSILIVTIVCVTIGIKYHDTLIIIIITALLIFLLNLGQSYYNKNLRNKRLSRQLQVNQILPEPENINPKNINLQNQELNSNQELEKVEKNNNKSEKPYHLQNTDDNIMDATTYNLDDCTTDMTCIQKPDENNLFTGYEKIDTYSAPQTKFNILDEKNKLEKSSLKKDNIVVENFTTDPLELIDVIKPFNNAVINPYKNYRMEEEISYDEDKYLSSKDISDNPCFHCKIGHCEDGVCRDINELKADELKNVVTEIKEMKRVHPFSKNFPTILATNPDAMY